MYCVRSAERDRLAAALEEAEIGFASYYEPPLHLQPALRYLGYAEGDFPETEKAARENLCLPLWAGIEEEQQAEVVAVLRRASTLVRSVISLPVNRHRVWQLAADAVLIAAAWWLAFFLRFDTTVPSYYRHLLSWRVIALVVAIKLTVFVLFGFYNRWWRYVSTRDMWGAARGVTVASLLAYLVLYAFPPGRHVAAAAPDRRARLPAPAGVRRRVAAARAHADRAPAVRASSPTARRC